MGVSDWILAIGQHEQANRHNDHAKCDADDINTIIASKKITTFRCMPWQAGWKDGQPKTDHYTPIFFM